MAQSPIKQRRIIKEMKQHHLYPTYRGIMNFYLNEYDRKGSISLTPTAQHLFDAIKYENIQLLVQILTKWKYIQPRTETQIENFKKFYLYKSKYNILR